MTERITETDFHSISQAFAKVIEENTSLRPINTSEVSGGSREAQAYFAGTNNVAFAIEGAVANEALRRVFRLSDIADQEIKNLGKQYTDHNVEGMDPKTLRTIGGEELARKWFEKATTLAKSFKEKFEGRSGGRAAD
jgi:hypothetical protein